MSSDLVHMLPYPPPEDDSADALTVAIEQAREEAKRFGLDPLDVLECWKAGVSVAAVVAYGESKGEWPKSET